MRWSNGDARSHHFYRKVTICGEGAFVARPGVHLIVGVVVGVLDDVAPDSQDFHRKGGSSSARVSPVLCALAQKTLAIEACLGDLGDIVANVGRSECRFASGCPVAHFVTTKADGGLGVAAS